MTGINGQVNGLNRDVFTTLQNIKSRNPGSSALRDADARELSAAINKDGTVDAAENDLLNELTQNRTRSIRISSSDASANSVSFTSTAGTTKAILNNTQKAHFNKLFSQGNEGFKELTAIYQRSPEDAQKVVDFLSAKASEAWDQSSVTNAYAPLRSLISTAYSGVNQLEGQANTDGRNMLHRAIEKLDRNPDGSNGSMPDFLYNWIRPGGVI